MNWIIHELRGRLGRGYSTANPPQRPRYGEPDPAYPGSLGKKKMSTIHTSDNVIVGINLPAPGVRGNLR
jgi:hypothetical protein